MPDYEKFGIWQDGYYMGTNNASTNDIYVFQRSQMLVGGTAQMVGFNNAWRPTTIDGFMCVPPVDNDGAFAPAGSPGLFITLNDDAIGGGSDQLWIYELAVNWTTPVSSTFNRVQQLNVPSFDSNFGANWDNIKQLGTTRELDGIPMVIMNVPQYRNFGTYQTLVCCHTVDVDATDHAGIRWYELRKTSGSWTLRQSGTYAPDGHSRWMGSVMLNGTNEIGLIRFPVQPCIRESVIAANPRQLILPATACLMSQKKSSRQQLLPRQQLTVGVTTPACQSIPLMTILSGIQLNTAAADRQRLQLLNLQLPS
jgi:hypothetical protein